jgi:[CysO sulfur-carrier protein]-S-L-cysteine hydrolase
MADFVRVRAEILEELLLHARREPEIECCGLLAGRDGVISLIFPAKNALVSATAFEIAPQELFHLYRTMRNEGLAHLGLYHSHPTGENVPSARDIKSAYYPAQAYFIISPRAGAPNPVRAFSIRDAQVQELKIVAVGE